MKGIAANGCNGSATTAHVRPSGLHWRAVVRMLPRLLRGADAKLCLPGALPAHGIHRVLVCRPNHRLGNALLISPLLAEIAVLYPGAEIDIVSAGNAAQALFSTRFQVRRVICLPRKIVRHLMTTAGLLLELRRTAYDLAIDPCVGSNSGRLLLLASQARYKVGFPVQPIASAWHGHLASLPAHLAQRGVFLLRMAYAGTTRPGWPPLNVQLAPVELRQGRQALANILGTAPDEAGAYQPVLGIFANATGSKRFAEAWWGSFATALRARWPNIRIVDVLAEHGCSQLPGTTPSFYTRDLRKLAAVLANMQGFISADCGVMHLAVAVGTPTLGLFARTNRDKYTPYGRGNEGIDIAADMSGDDAARRAASWIESVAWTHASS